MRRGSGGAVQGVLADTAAATIQMEFPVHFGQSVLIKGACSVQRTDRGGRGISSMPQKPNNS